MFSLYTYRVSYKQREELKRDHSKLRNGKIIYKGFMRIFSFFRCRNSPQSRVADFDSDVDNTVKMTLVEQRVIEWDQVLKGRLSNCLVITKEMIYNNKTETR